MTAAAVGGPLGAAMSAPQKTMLRELLHDLERTGIRFWEDRGVVTWPGSPRLTHRTPDEVMQLLEQNPPGFETQLLMENEGSKPQPIRSLSDLRDLSALQGLGSTEHLSRPGFAGAVRDLYKDGWKFSVKTPSWDGEMPLGPFGAFRQGEGLVLARLELRMEVREPEDLLAAHVLLGTGEEQSLSRPELARALKDVQRSGLDIDPSDTERFPPGIWGAYLSLKAGETARLSFQGARLETVRGRVDEALERCGEEVEVIGARLKPCAEQGLLPSHELGEFLELLRQPVSGTSLQDRAGWLDRLVRSDRTLDAWERSRAVRQAYLLVVTEPSIRVDPTAELAAEIGLEKAVGVLEYVWKELPNQTPFPETCRERAAWILCLARSGAGLGQVRRAAELMAIPVDGTPAERRLELLQALARAGARQAEYDGVARDYETLLRHRSPDQSLEETGRLYCRLLEAMASAGAAEQTAPTFAFMQEGLRLGHLGAGSLGALTEQFVARLILTGDAEDSRRHLAAPETAGKIQVGETEVDVGGVRLSRKRR